MLLLFAAAQIAAVAESPASACSQCASSEAFKFLRSGESAETIVTAALARCDRELDLPKLEYRNPIMSDPYVNSTAKRHPEAVRASVNQYGADANKLVHDQALGNVLTLEFKINEDERLAPNR